VTGRAISPEQKQNDSAVATAIATAGSTAVVPTTDAQALEMIRDEWLRPLIAEIGELREELGKVKAERDAALERLAVREQESPVQTLNVAPAGTEREPEGFPKQRWPWWMRILAGK